MSLPRPSWWFAPSRRRRSTPDHWLKKHLHSPHWPGSNCQGPPQLAKLSLPALVIQSMADMGVFPSDARKIHAALASPDKTLEFLPGAHYFEDSEINRTRVADLMAAWITARV